MSADLQLLSQRTGLVHSLLEEVRAAVLLQCAPRPTTAADLWDELKTTLTVFSTGGYNIELLPVRTLTVCVCVCVCVLHHILCTGCSR